VASGRGRRTADALKRLDGRPGLVKAARALRGLLPGDRDYGDPLSVAGNAPSHLVGQRLASATADRPSALREAGMGALQVWQSISEAQGRGRGERELTILFTDLVGSTQTAAALGDRAWTALLASHNDAVRRELARLAGEEIDTAGDGFLALFDGPARAIRCGLAIRDALRPLGLEVRCGVHTGEVERPPGEKPRGIAVHVGARVMALAGAGEVFVTSTTRDLVAGSGLEFADRGEHQLKGIDGPRRLFAAV
jgi:class 3 adenylate cyclase